VFDMRRPLLILTIALSGSLLFQAPALATCPNGVPFDAAVSRALTVWWGTVTEAGVTGAAAPGQWGLTVKVVDVLKGSGPEATNGASGTVFVSSCGPALDQDQSRAVATEFLGDTRLFIGRFDGSVFIEHFGPVQMNGMSEQQQYQRALVDVGLRRPPIATQTHQTSAPWPWTRIAAASLLLAGLIVFALTRRLRQRSK
jgi:hypothetical protein